MKFVVRPASVDDADRMADVHIAAWKATYEGVFPDELLARLDRNRFSSNWARSIDDATSGRTQDVTHLVGEIDGIVQGFCLVGPFRDHALDDDPSGELWVINLNPSAHGTGLATRLHSRGVDQLRSDGHHRAALWVVVSNRRARRFYEREGWTDDGITKEETFDDRVVVEARYSISL